MTTRSGGPAFVVALSLGATLALAASAALALVGRTERGEWLLFAFAFGGVLPGSLVLAWRLVGWRRATWARAAAAAVGAAGLIAAARIVHALELTGDAAAAALLAAAAMVTAAVAVPFGNTRRLDLGRNGSRAGRLAPAMAAVAVGVLALAFVPRDLLTLPKVALAAAVAVIVAQAYARLRVLRAPTRLAPALDVLVGAVVFLVVTDVMGYASGGAGISSGRGLTADNMLPYVQAHQDYYLGPVSDVLHGRALLVDSASQYGVGSMYLLAAWFLVAPLGYGPLGLLAGVLTAAQYAVGYSILRAAGCTRLIGAVAMAMATAVAVLAAFASPALLPNSGGLRFCLPFVLVLVAVLSARRSEASNPLALGSLLVLAVASVWAIETFIYVAGGFAGIAAVDSAIGSESVRAGLRRLGEHAGRAALAVAMAHSSFAIGTRLIAGDWPDWGWYLDYFQTYSTGGYSMATASPWSPAWLIGAVCFASIVGVVVIVATNRALAIAERAALLAISGTAAVGTTFLTYFVGRSLDFLAVFIALPAVLLCAMWLAFALRSSRITRSWRTAIVGLCAWTVVLGIALAWPGTRQRWPRTALAHVLPGGRSLSSDLSRLWDSPPLDPRSVAGERLIDRHLGKSDRALVIVEPDLATEILIRTGRVNLLPISYAWEDDLVFDRQVPAVREAVGRIRPGTRMLIQPAITARSPAPPTVGVVALFGGKPISRLQRAALRSIRSRFDLRPVATGGAGLEVVELVRRTPGSVRP